MSDYLDNVMIIGIFTIILISVVCVGLAIMCPDSCTTVENNSTEVYTPIVVPPTYLFMHDLNIVGEEGMCNG